ncbi:MAG TPA: FAD-dependent oxidoreductase, partial [Chryseosolibacter sp.]|nr:FAD-dependent oxidoreductase [Chryseosolibacter sp.]
MPGPDHTNTIIVGGGAAGLACAVCLARRGIPYIVLEKNVAGGQSWSQRYERLHLHTPRNSSSLPLLPMPRYYPKYVSKDDVARYLELYATTFDVTPRFNQKVMRAERKDNVWKVSTDKQTFSSDHLIIA